MGASTALCYPAVQSSYYAHESTANGSCRHSPIARLCRFKRQHPGSLSRLQLTVPSASECLNKASSHLNGFQFKVFLPSRHVRFPAAASSDDSSSVPVKGNEIEDSNKLSNGVSNSADDSQKASNAEVFEASKTISQSQKDAVLKAERASEGNNGSSVLRDTTEELKEQAEMTRTNAPDPVREIADTAVKAHSADTPKNFAKIHDFCLGIPYGTILIAGGLLWFVISGRISAIYFGVLFGVVILGLSVSSLNAWKGEKPTDMYIKGQAVISAVLAFRQMRNLLQVKRTFPSAIVTIAS
ncbi:hypothetical protein KP509_14G065500 [Ceratopteris richardii]|nr:hypothetical protein KP509_14G065500 [Ceratopteris richardii]